MPIKLAALLLLLASAWLAGCSTTNEVPAGQTSAPFEPTVLIIADESGPMTIEELAARRPAIVDYLVSRGYLESPDALVDNPALASRIIRVILSPGGSFRITEFTLGNRARHLNTTTSYYPGHSDDYRDYGRYGYYNYTHARPDYPRHGPVAAIPTPDAPPPSTPTERPRDDQRPRRHERRFNPEGRGSTREHPRADNPGGGGSSAPTSPPSAPPSYSPPPETRSSGESRFEERNRPHDP